MKRLASFLVRLLFLAVVVAGSFSFYVGLHRDSGAVPSALLAGFTSLNPRTVSYAGEGSEKCCLEAYYYLKSHTSVQIIENLSDSRYNPNENLVYLTEPALLTDSAEAVHEFGHALDRHLYGERPGYFSRQEAFSQAYAADHAYMQQTFLIQDLFKTQAYRNLAVSDILFAMLYENAEATKTLTSSYDTAGVPYWRHEKAYMSEQEKRQTEVFADIFTIFLSDDEAAKRFLQTYMPASSELFLDTVGSQVW